MDELDTSPAHDPPGPSMRVVIEPARGLADLDLGGVWRHHELLLFLVWRDLKVRYKQTVIGGAWAVAQPLATAVVFSVFFGRLARIPSDGAPYPLFAFTGLLPWTFFATGLTQAANSLVGNQHLITKIYFPRLIIPVASTLSGLLDLVVALAALAALLLWYDRPPGPLVLALPAFVLLALGTGLGAGLWLSALNVEFRDIRHVVPFLVQFWLFATPIAYPASIVPPEYRTLYALNPMVAVVEGFRWALLGTPRPDPSALLVSTATMLVLLLGGALFFRRLERSFADVI